MNQTLVISTNLFLFDEALPVSDMNAPHNFYDWS